MTRLCAHLGGKKCVFFSKEQKEEYEDFFFRARDEILIGLAT
jgi:hypothetical protein